MANHNLIHNLPSVVVIVLGVVDDDAALVADDEDVVAAVEQWLDYSYYKVYCKQLTKPIANRSSIIIYSLTNDSTLMVTGILFFER